MSCSSSVFVGRIVFLLLAALQMTLQNLVSYVGVSQYGQVPVGSLRVDLRERFTDTLSLTWLDGL